MQKNKCVIRFEKRKIATKEERDKYKDIVKNTVNTVLESQAASDICDSCISCGLLGFEVNVLFTDDESIRIINKEHRNIDRSTDVLSFPLNDFSFGSGEILLYNADEDTGRLLLGDIVISVPTICYQANEYGHSVERECAFLVCHGMLHLLGYDHMNENEEKQMFGFAENILDKAGYKRI